MVGPPGFEPGTTSALAQYGSPGWHPTKLDDGPFFGSICIFFGFWFLRFFVCFWLFRVVSVCIYVLFRGMVWLVMVMRDGLYLVLIGVLFVLAAAPWVSGYMYASFMGGSMGYGGMMMSGDAGDHCTYMDGGHMDECYSMMDQGHMEECEEMMASYGGAEHMEECESMMAMYMSSGMGCH